MMSAEHSAALTRSFEAHDLDNTTFHHAEHVQVAFDLLNKYDFIDAASIYAKGIRAIATKAGAPHKFNLTITYAFMSLIAERMTQSACKDIATFFQQNPDLLSKEVLGRWYRPERLQSGMARNIFLMPASQDDCLAKGSEAQPSLESQD